jgi:hypothetical protein
VNGTWEISFLVLNKHTRLPTPHASSSSISPPIICVLHSIVALIMRLIRVSNQSEDCHYLQTHSRLIIAENKNLANPNRSDWRGCFMHSALVTLHRM